MLEFTAKAPVCAFSIGFASLVHSAHSISFSHLVAELVKPAEKANNVP